MPTEVIASAHHNLNETSPERALVAKEFTHARDGAGR